MSDDHVTRVVQKSVTDKAQFVEPQDVTVRPQMPPFKAFLVGLQECAWHLMKNGLIS